MWTFTSSGITTGGSCVGTAVRVLVGIVVGTAMGAVTLLLLAERAQTGSSSYSMEDVWRNVLVSTGVGVAVAVLVSWLLVRRGQANQ
jgi:hypothetical protein